MRFNLKAGRLMAAVAGTVLAAGLASAPARAEITGVLQCNVASGIGVIVVSQRAVSCVFRSNDGGNELYRGTISRLGVDIGSQTAGTLVYNVAELGNPGPGALAGAYVGPGFGVTIGSGGGLNALVGGNGNSITLQPIAATTSTGLNVNAGLGALDLHFAGLERPLRRGRGMRRHYRGMRHHHGMMRRHHGMRG